MMKRIFFLALLAILTITACAPAPTSTRAPTPTLAVTPTGTPKPVVVVAARSTKIAQLVGDFDRERQQPISPGDRGPSRK